MTLTRGTMEATWQSYLATGDMAATARRLGLTREAVRCRLVRHVGRGLIGLVQERQRARARLRAYRWSDNATWKPCYICGAMFKVQGRDTRWGTCPDHQPYQTQIRLQVDPARHQSHRSTPSQSADPDKPPNRRYVVPGSRCDHIYSEAVKKGWPLVDLLPPAVLAHYRP